MQVGPDPLSIRREEVGFGRQKVLFLNDWFHLRVDVVQLVLRVNVWHVAGVQDVVQIFQERLALDLQSMSIYHSLIN